MKMSLGHIKPENVNAILESDVRSAVKGLLNDLEGYKKRAEYHKEEGQTQYSFGKSIGFGIAMQLIKKWLGAVV